MSKTSISAKSVVALAGAIALAGCAAQPPAVSSAAATGATAPPPTSSQCLAQYNADMDARAGRIVASTVFFGVIGGAFSASNTRRSADERFERCLAVSGASPQEIRRVTGGGSSYLTSTFSL